MISLLPDLLPISAGNGSLSPNSARTVLKRLAASSRSTTPSSAPTEDYSEGSLLPSRDVPHMPRSVRHLVSGLMTNGRRSVTSQNGSL